MKIWKKIILGFIAIITIMIIADFLSLKNNIQLINEVKRLEQSNRVELTQSNNIAFTTQRIKSNLRELFLELEIQQHPQQIINSRQIVKNGLSLLTEFTQELNKATSMGYTMAIEKDEQKEELEELKMVDSLNTMVTNFNVSVHKILNLQDKHNFEEARELFETDTEPSSNNIQELISILAQDAEEEVELSIEKMGTQVDKAIQLGIYLTILSVFLAMAIGFYISNSISSSLNKLIKSTREISKGNLETSVELKSKDELQSLAESFNDMSKQIKLKIKSIDNLNNELTETNNTKDTFFSIIAHDLRSPFNAILGYSDLLYTNYHDFDEEKRIKFIGYINKSAKQTFELLENLLTWSRSQSNKIQINKETLNLSTIINKSIALYTPNAKDKNITVINNISNKLTVFADSFTLSVVINNIINNAIKFTPNNGYVTISAQEQAQSKQVEISIKDTGVGMSPETVEYLLQSKTNTSNLGTNKEIGTGLGLALIKTFVNKNDGQLWVKSEINKGSEFKFSLLQ